MVGHSYGNIAIVYYMLQHGSDTSLPKLVKQVDIAGHFNGIIGMDESGRKLSRWRRKTN